MGCAPSIRFRSRQFGGSETNHSDCRGVENNQRASLPYRLKNSIEEDNGFSHEKFISSFTMGDMHFEDEKIQIAIASPKRDATITSLVNAIDSLDTMTYQLFDKSQSLLNSLESNQLPDLIIIDRRENSKSFDADNLARTISSRSSSEKSLPCIPLVALVALPSHSKQEEPISNLFEAGYTRRWLEVQHSSSYVNELLMFHKNDYRASIGQRGATGLLSAIDYISEPIVITNAQYKIQYVNQSYESIFGFSSQDAIAQDLRHLHHTDSCPTEFPDDALQACALKGKNWQGTLDAKRKNGAMLHNPTTVLPLIDKGRRLRHFIFIYSPITAIENAQARTSSIRDQDSYTSGSINGRRRDSVARIHSMTIEAPITKVINIINAAQANSSSKVSQDLEKVIEILHTTDLYSGVNKTSDPVTSDLIEGLMTSAKTISERTEQQRKLSGTVGLKRGSSRTSELSMDQRLNLEAQGFHHSTLPEVPDEISECLNNEEMWSYNIIELERVTSKRPLVYLAMKTFNRFGVSDFLKISEVTLRNWLQVIEDNYHMNNPYHNSTHAADVMHSSAYFLDRERIKAMMEPIDEVSSLIAAVIHDVDHPGRTNPYLINCRDRLAVLYNDISVLESHHVSLAFQLTYKDERINIFQNVPREEMRILRQYIIDMVLATDMSKHFEHLTKFINTINKPLLRESTTHEDGMDGTNSLTGSRLSVESAEFQELLCTPESRALVKRMLIKCSDVSNPARPFDICKTWALRIAEEYFSQTDEEKTKGLPVVMPMFDRNTCVIPKSQLSFIDFFLKNMFEAWDVFCDVPELVRNISLNIEKWNEELQASS